MKALGFSIRFSILFIGFILSSLSITPSFANKQTVSLPSITDSTFSPRIIYIENQRFPQVSDAELRTIVQTAASLVSEHFGVIMKIPPTIETSHIDGVFKDLVSKTPDWFPKIMGDFRGGNVDWENVKNLLIEQINSYSGSLDDQIAFAGPYLTVTPTSSSVDAFADSVVETFRTRLSYWTKATLADGYPIIGEVAGRKDLPLNEYGYWTLMAKLGVEAEIVLTNQFVASVEYIPTPVHTSIRGGITGGSTEYNPASKLGASVWMSIAPFLMNDRQINDLRRNKNYSRKDALRYAGVLLAHEIGHLVMHFGHPWSNEACLMRPAEVLDFASWEESLNAEKCLVGSDPEMIPGVIKIPIW